jgi:regulator of sirC expression with transglutaminase-like and TPR domain
MRAWILFLLLVAAVPSLHAGKKKQAPYTLPTNATSLYRTLDPKSLLQHLAFYELYPDTVEGKKALEIAWTLLTGKETLESEALLLPSLDVYSIIGLVTKKADDASIEMGDEQLCILERVAGRLENRKLKGFAAWTKEDVLALPSTEIDLGRSLLIYQFQNDIDAKQKIRHYEATLDLMALQILAHMKQPATAEDIIGEINQFIFRDMRFRFPPHSLYAKDIDLYTFLPSVLDSRQGVCLGVSTLYLCLAQRIGLELDIITPPGHIYVSYQNGPHVINIETTARGINLPSDTYLGINTKSLQKRNMKEVVGMAFFNQASVMLGKEDFTSAIKLYETAREYIPDDPLVKMLLGINYLFAGKKKEGEALLKQVQGLTFDGAIAPETMPEDYLTGKVDAKGIKMVFMPVDENRESIIAKQNELKAHLKKYPKFRAGLLQLATTYLQLGRGQEAYDVLMRYHKIDPTNPTIEYYLCIICMQRYDYMKAWAFYTSAEKIVSEAGHHPKALKSLKASLQRIAPSPL